MDKKTTLCEKGSEGDQRQNPVQEWTASSAALHIFLPIVGLALLWGQRNVFSKLLLQLDRSCVSVFCPSLSKREKLLKWAGGRLPSTWSSQARTLCGGIPELWKDGSLLCTLINSAIPGACPNPHRHWKKPPLHAQALAYKYLGLPPIFSETELSGELTINQERNFIHYLQELQQAINKWPTRQEASHNYSSQYVARGMGLYTGEQYRKTVFYIYSNLTNKKRDNVLMHIRGPYGTQGKATIPPFHNLKNIPVVNVLQNQLEATKTLLFRNKEQKSFLKTISLDFTSLVTGVEDQNADDIPIQVDMEIDRAKVTYIPYNTGMYEINLISNGELLQGSPYNVRVINNETGVKDNFIVEPEDVEEKIIYTKRKILSKVIDCIDEKIYIDNGTVSTIDAHDYLDKDLTITAITKKNDEILKTEVNCSLDDIIEEVADVFDGNTTPASKLDTNLQNFVNSPNKQNILDIILPTEFPTSNVLEQDKNNNSSTQTITSKISLEIVPLNNQSTNSCKPLDKNTSPVCPDHIVPEVVTNNFNELPVAEKRKLFSKCDTPVYPNSRCSTSSVAESENVDETQSKGSSFQELSVLNILDTIKKSDISEHDSLWYSTVSLPNMHSSTYNDHEDSFNNFKAKKDYWERMSSQSSSVVSLTDSDFGHNKISVSNRNIFNKINYNVWDDKIVKYQEQGQKSAAKSIEDLSSKKLNTSSLSESIKFSKSVDNSLDQCSILSVEERKKMLFKKQCEDINNDRYLPKKLNFNNNNTTTDKKQLQAVQKFQKLNNVLQVEETETQDEPKKNSQKRIFSSQFKKAINFFKNLEVNAKQMITKNKQDVSRRRFSLDFRINSSNKDGRKGGSLNLPRIAERFSINNLYEDVFGSRRGSFRGTPNNVGVANSLASFPEKLECNDLTETKDEIKYNMFVNKSRNKKRKSIKTLFDINY